MLISDQKKIGGADPRIAWRSRREHAQGSHLKHFEQARGLLLRERAD